MSDEVPRSMEKPYGVPKFISSKLWEYRGLKTLSISFVGRQQWDGWSRNMTLFGYISRTCPQLLELSVTVRDLIPIWSLELVLLTRLRDLRRLELRLHESFADTISKPVRRSDYAWIQQMNPNRIRLPDMYWTLPSKNTNLPKYRKKSLVSIIGQFLDKASQWSETVRDADPVVDFKHCLGSGKEKLDGRVSVRCI